MCLHGRKVTEYRFSRVADTDLKSIAEYTIQTFGVDQMSKYTNDILDTASKVAEKPSRCRSYITRSGDKFLRHNSGNHALFFIERTYGVLIVRILHQAMDFDSHLE